LSLPFSLHIPLMPRKRNNGLFTWDEAQCFVGMDNVIATSYTNEHLTITFVQDGEGKLTHFAYETDDTDGEVQVHLNKKENE
jgi:hypothetical protein